MAKHAAGLAMLVLIVWTGWAAPSHAQATGDIRVVFAKAGLIAGAGRDAGS